MEPLASKFHEPPPIDIRNSSRNFSFNLSADRSPLLSSSWSPHRSSDDEDSNTVEHTELLRQSYADVKKQVRFAGDDAQEEKVDERALGFFLVELFYLPANPHGSLWLQRLGVKLQRKKDAQQMHKRNLFLL